MKPIEVQLLESLGSGVRPFDVHDAENPKVGIEFDSMLDHALHGRAESELGVRFAPSVSGTYELTDQSRIARGIDLAAAAGVDHALILHEQRTLRVDVRNRIVLESFPIDDQQVIDGIDGFVAIQPLELERSGASMPSDQSLHAPARVVRNASLVHALAGKVPEYL